MQGSPPQCELVDMANQAIVTIAVKNRKLRMYPRRSHDVVSYFKDSGSFSPEKPDQVRWVVRDMEPEQSVVIRAKTDGTGVFPLDEYVITSGCNSILSGMPLRGPETGCDLNWSYSIELLENGKRVDVIDPMVIVKNDP